MMKILDDAQLNGAGASMKTRDLEAHNESNIITPPLGIYENMNH